MKKNKLREKKSFKTTVYVTLRLIVLLTAIRQFSIGNYAGVFVCILTLILFLIPSILEKRMNLDLPDTLEIIIYLFIFSAEILGEINSFYIHFEYWDLMLHTMNGFMMAAIGFALIDILNKHDKFHITLSPVFVSIMAFSFSMTTGVVWELFEYAMDQTFLLDMQKDTIVNEVQSVVFDESNQNITINVPIESIVINGEDWQKEYGGYIDIGLHDTMEDLFVNLVGAVVFSIIGWFYLAGGTDMITHFIPRTNKKERSNIA